MNYKNIILTIIAVTLLVGVGIFAWSVMQKNKVKEAELNARKECSSEIMPRAADYLAYSGYHKCMASKGFFTEER